jgi:hypothetical protein
MPSTLEAPSAASAPNQDCVRKPARIWNKHLHSNTSHLLHVGYLPEQHTDSGMVVLRHLQWIGPKGIAE